MDEPSDEAGSAKATRRDRVPDHGFAVFSGIVFRGDRLVPAAGGASVRAFYQPLFVPDRIAPVSRETTAGRTLSAN
jgi:hypothetical protein